MKTKSDFWYALIVLCMWIGMGYVLHTNIEELIKFEIFKIANIAAILAWLSILVTELFYYRTSSKKKIDNINEPKMKVYGSSNKNIE